MELIKNLWKQEEQMLMERLNKDIMAGPTLTRKDLSRIFYIKTDWSKDGMGVILLQADDSVDARKTEAK